MNRWIRLSDPAILFNLLSFLNQLAVSVELGFVDYTAVDLASSNGGCLMELQCKMGYDLGLEFKN